MWCFAADAGQWSPDLSNLLLSEPLIGWSELSAILALLVLVVVAVLMLERLHVSVVGPVVGVVGAFFLVA